MRILAVRNRNLSLWQSAVSEVAAKFAHSDPKLMSAMELAACMHAAAAANGVDIQPPAPDATITNDSSPSNLRALAYAWQFLGMDTGYNDRDPTSPMAPGLQPSELKWHRDKLDRFRGSTIMLSHHQLFSAHAKLGDGPRAYLNENLYAAFKPYFDRIAAWYWGHEHNFVVFKDGQLDLTKGRLIGCSAYEESSGEDPYEIEFADLEYAPNMKKLNFSPYQTGMQQNYNHAMALLDVSPAKIDVTYFEYPSWDRDFTPPWVDQPSILSTETIAPKPGFAVTPGS